MSLQACESDLHKSRIAHRESVRAEYSTKGLLAHLASQQQALAAQALRVQDRRNTVYIVHFGFAESRVVLPEDLQARLVAEARAAALVALRGRTDGSAESSAESRIARERSESVRDLLIGAGVDPVRIRTTWQPVGDHASDNTREGGRRLNRRVEIELYPAAPHIAALEASSQP